MAARNIAIQFGELVNIPAKAHVAVEKPAELANLCPGQPGYEDHEPAPVKAPRTCPHCGPITDYERLVKGIKQGKSYVLVSQEEIAQAKETYAGQYKGAINLVVHPAEEFDRATAPGEGLYYLTPASDAQAGQYQTLRELIGDHPELAFVGLYTPVSVTSLYRLVERDGLLMLQQRTRSQSLRAAPSVPGEPLAQLRKFLEMLLVEDGAVVPYDASAYEDGYQAAIVRLAESAANGVVTLDKPSVSTSVHSLSDADLVAKLEALKEAS